MTHYIGMAGLHGCIPQTCDVYDTHEQAAESLASIHDLGKRRARTLQRDGYLELNLSRDGNDYCEIEACDCAEPWTHSDSQSEKEYREDHDLIEPGTDFSEDDKILNGAQL